MFDGGDQFQFQPVIAVQPLPLNGDYDAHILRVIWLLYFAFFHGVGFQGGDEFLCGVVLRARKVKRSSPLLVSQLHFAPFVNNLIPIQIQ